jgi:hypothetical protein
MYSSEKNFQHARWRLPATHVQALVGALRSSGMRKSVTSEQRLVIREICLAPERGHYAPEDFLIAFKLALVEAATAANIPPGPDRNDLLAHLVTVYIDEFYRAPGLNRTSLADDAQGLAPGH